MIRTAWNWILTRLFGPEEDITYESTTSRDDGQCKCGKRPSHTYVDGDTI
jgi:hypothetical protein